MHEARVLSGFAFISIIALMLLLAGWNTMTGNVAQCPLDYSAAGGYCVHSACQNQQVKCIVQGDMIKPPDCTCTSYMGSMLCAILGGEETAVKSPLCTRRGQIGTVCGFYNSSSGSCVSY
jgi:hypothetical protein